MCLCSAEFTEPNLYVYGADNAIPLYVGLDKLPDLEQTSEATESSTDPTSVTDCLDDATIEEGDEHTRQITGGPSGSMLALKLRCSSSL